MAQAQPHPGTAHKASPATVGLRLWVGVQLAASNPSSGTTRATAGGCTLNTVPGWPEDVWRKLRPLAWAEAGRLLNPGEPCHTLPHPACGPGLAGEETMGPVDRCERHLHGYPPGVMWEGTLGTI